MDCACVMCGYRWKSRVSRPGRCRNRKCQTPHWEKPSDTGRVVYKGDSLWLKVKNVPISESCIEWDRTRQSKCDGYGQVLFEGRLWLTHRLSFHLHRGEIVPGMCVCHSCDNKACYNPLHLFLGTRVDNMQDCLSKGRFYRAAGELSRNAHLTESDVKEIRQARRYKGYLTDLSAKYQVSKSAIADAMKGRTWKHVA